MKMKKSLLWIVVVVMSISMIAAFSLYGCKAEEEAAVEEAAAEEEVAEEVAVEEEVAEEAAVEQIYREGYFAGGPRPTFITTSDHRLDITVNEPLVAITWQGGLKELLAESYEMKENGKVWVMHLRKDVKWHDGEDFTADDVVFSYNAYANPEVGSIWASKAASIKGFEDVQNGTAEELTGIKVIDPYTVQIELSNPIPLWIRIEQTYLVIFPEHLLGDIPADELLGNDYWRNRIGTGPFKWIDFKEDQYILLERNEDHYLGAPKLEKLIYQMYAETTTMISALVAGEIDTTAYEGTVISPQEAPNLAEQEHLEIVKMEKGSPAFIILNHDKEWSDVRIRQAIRYAIDVDSMLEAIYPGAKPAYTLLPQEWTHPNDMNTYDYNPEKAKQLLEEAGWSGRTVDFIYYFGDEQSKNLVAAIQQYLGDVGIDIKPRLLEGGAGFNTAENSKDFDMGLVGQGMGLDPSGGEFVIKTGEPRAHGYSNPRIDELLQEGKLLANQEEREPIYQEISKIYNEALPQVPLWYDIRFLGFNKRVVGSAEHYREQKLIYFNMPVYNEIETWYIAE